MRNLLYIYIYIYIYYTYIHTYIYIYIYKCKVWERTAATAMILELLNPKNYCKHLSTCPIFMGK